MPSPLRNEHGEYDDRRRLLDWSLQRPPRGYAAERTRQSSWVASARPNRMVTCEFRRSSEAKPTSSAVTSSRAPELVIEIARSSRSYDLNGKKAEYEEAGVQEYIVVELDPDRVHWFVRRGDHFEDLSPGADGIYRSEAFPGLWLDPVALLNEDLDRLM